MNDTHDTGRAVWIQLVLLSLLWGGSFFFAKIALADFPPLTLVWLRVILACITLALIMRLTGHAFPRSPSLWLACFAMGLLNNLVPFSLLFFGQLHIGAGLAAIFNALVPVFTVVAAHFFTRDEPLDRYRLGGVMLGFIGVALLVSGPDATHGKSTTLEFIAMIACIVAAASYGLAAVYGRRFHAMGMTPLQVAFGQLAGTSVMMTPVALLIDQPIALPIPSVSSWLALAALAIACTGLAYILYFRILAASGATTTSLVAFLIPISAIALSALFLDERLQLNQLAGMLVIFVGLCCINPAIRRNLHQRMITGRTPIRHLPFVQPSLIGTLQCWSQRRHRQTVKGTSPCRH
ncbi:MAG: DMT family transporter [Pseudomonadota bacterium]